MPRRSRRGGRRVNPPRTSQGLQKASKRIPVLHAVQSTIADFYPSAGRLVRTATPEKIRDIFASASRNIGQQMEFAHEIEQIDDHIRGTLALRRASVLGMPVTVESGKPGDQAADAAAHVARKIIELPWYTNALKWLLGGTLKQHAAVELIWSEKSVDTGEPGVRDLWMPRGIRTIEPWRWQFREGIEGPMIFTDTTRSESSLRPLEAGKYMVHSWDANSSPGDFALIRAVSKWWWLSHLGLIDWGRMVENWGLPIPVFEYETGSTTQSIETIADNLVAAAGQKTIALPAGTKYEVVDVPDRQPHKDFRECYEKVISRLLLGQTKSQIDTGTANTGANLQGEVRDDIRVADATALDASVRETFWEPWTVWNFGETTAPPIVTLTESKKRDPEASGRVFKIAQELGLPLQMQEVYKELNIDIPVDENGTAAVPDIIKPPAAAPTPGFAELPQMPTGTFQTITGPTGPDAVSDTGLSGVQITSLTEILSKVTNREMSPETAEVLVREAFPTFDRESIASMVKNAAAFDPPSPEPGEASPQLSAKRARVVNVQEQLELQSETDAATRESAKQLEGHVAAIRKMATDVEKEFEGQADAIKFVELMRRLPELLREFEAEDRVDLMTLATVAAYGHGAIDTDTQIGDKQ